MPPIAAHPTERRLPASYEEVLSALEAEASESTRSLESLKASERRYRRLFETAPDGILIVDPVTQRIVDANPSMARLLGWAPGELVGNDLAQAGLYLDLGANALALAHLRSVGSAYTDELQVRTRGGGTLTLEIVCNLYEESGRPFIQCNLRDITAHKKEEAGMLRLAAVIHSSPDAIISKDAEGLVTTWNPGAERLFGFTAAEMMGESVLRIVPPDLRERALEAHARLRQGQKIEHFETVALTKDGRRVDVSLTMSPLKDPNGRVIGTSTIARDISGHVKAEAALRHSEARFREVADAAPVVIWAAGPEKNFNYFNKAWLSFTGHSQPELDTAWADHLHPEDMGRCMETFHRSFAARKPFEMEYRLRHHTGVHRWVMDRGIPRFSPSGEFEGYIGAGVDIHDQKQAAEAIRHANEASSRAKDEFLAVLSHELRTPLAPVLMLASAMEQDMELPAATREDLTMIRKNVELEARLIDDLLDLTRITQGKMVLRFENLDPHALITHTLEILRGDLRAKQIHVEVIFCDPPPFIRADGVRLRQVFWNILKNAVKFTPQKGQISIVSHTQNRLWRLEITDTGLGIPEDELPHIFTAFKQGREASEPRFGGVGLGLAISEHITKEHKGRIWAESAGRGLGSTFHLELPLAPLSTSGRIRLPPPEPQHRPLSVLLVEDHEASRATLARLLSLRGHTVTPAATLAEALAQAGAGMHDIVVSDLGLPDGSGHDLMRELRSTHPHLRGIALSGYGMASDVKHSQEAGFQEHLTKPADVATLERAMLRVCEGGR